MRFRNWHKKKLKIFKLVVSGGTSLQTNSPESTEKTNKTNS